MMMMMGAEAQVFSRTRERKTILRLARAPSVLKGFINAAHMGFCGQAAEANGENNIVFMHLR
jgi:hypothetical protein